jgi:uncharacterized protein
MYLYLHMAQGNCREYLRGEVVWVKKYFYVLRPLLAIRWIEQGRGPVPVLFTDLLATIADRPELLDAIEQLLERKRAGEELDRGPAIPVISDFAAAELTRLEALHPDPRAARPGLEPLNLLSRSILRETWAVP